MQVFDWQIIIKTHGPLVWQKAYRLLGSHSDAADCFQETFVAALEVARRQRIRNFGALLARLATTKAIDRLRQRSRHLQHSTGQANLDGLYSKNPSPAKNAEAHELADRLRMAISQLPPQEAKAFCMRYLNDMSYRQIAKELRIKTNTAGVLLYRAKLKIRDFLTPVQTQKNEVAL